MAILVQAYMNAYRLRECLPLTRSFTAYNLLARVLNAYKSAYCLREGLPLTRVLTVDKVTGSRAHKGLG